MKQQLIKFQKMTNNFSLYINGKNCLYDKVIIATGGPSIPKMGASDFGYRIARQFGHDIVPIDPALVPLTFTDDVTKFNKITFWGRLLIRF